MNNPEYRGGMVRRLLLVVAVLVVAVSAVVVPAGAQQAVPARPSGLAVVSVAHDAVSLSWDDPADASVTHYQVLRRDRDVDAPGVFATIEDDTGSAAASYVDATAEPERRYVYRVVAVSAGGESRRSGYVNVTTSAIPPQTQQESEVTTRAAEEPAAAVLYTPAAPTGVTAVYTDGAVTVSWNDPADPGVTSFGVWRRDREVDTSDFDLVVQHAPAGVFRYVDRAVSYDTQYAYVVMAWGSGTLEPGSLDNSGLSTPSAEAAVDVPPQQAAVPPPASNTPVVQWPQGVAEWGDLTTHESSAQVSGSADAQSEELLYGFTLSDVRAVTFALTQDTTVTGFSLEDIDGEVIVADTTPDSPYELLQVLDAGAYLVRLSPNQGAAGDFALSVDVSAVVTEAMLGADAPEDATSRVRMPVGTRIAGTFLPDSSVDASRERDWVGIDLEQGIRYTVLPGGSHVKVEGLVSAGGRTYRARMTFTAKEDGLHFLKLRRDAQSHQTKPYSIAVVQVDDPRGCDRGSAGTVSVGGSVDGAFDWGTGGLDYWNLGDFDCDWFAVPFTAGRLYRLHLEAVTVPGSALPPAQNPQLKYPRRANGERAHPAVQDWMTDAFDNLLYFGATETETHYVPVQAMSDWVWSELRRDLVSGGLGTYRLSVEDVTPEVDTPADRTTTSRVAPDGTALHDLIVNHLDEDWHVVALEAGKSYRIAASSWHGAMLIKSVYSGDWTTPRPGMEGTSTTMGAHGTAEAVFTPTRSGDHYIAVGSNASAARPYRSGPYELSVSEVEAITPESFADIKSGALAFILTESNGWTDEVIATGALPPDDGDAWLWTVLEADKNYKTEFGTDRLAGLFYRRGVYDSSGNILPRSDEGAFSPPRDGAYYIRIGFRRGKNSGEHWPYSTTSMSATVTVSVTDEELPTDPPPPVPPPPPPLVQTPEEQMFNSREDSQTVELVPDVAHVKAAVGDGAAGNTGPGDGASGSAGPSAGVSTRGTSDWVTASAAKTTAWSTKTASATPKTAAATPKTAAATTTSSAGSGTAGDGELDWFMVTLPGGDGLSYWLELLGGEHFDDDGAAPVIAGVFDADGEPVYMHRSGEPMRRWQLAPAQDMTYYIAVASNGNGYAITVVDTAPPQGDPSGSPARVTAADALGVGLHGRLMGMIDSGSDVDCFAVALEGNVTYRIDMEGLWDGHRDPGGHWVAIGTLNDSAIDGVYDPWGNLVPGTDDPASNDAGEGLNARLSFTPAVPGDHTVCVSGRYSWTGTYRLSAMETGTTGDRLALVWSGEIDIASATVRNGAYSGYSMFGNGGEGLGKLTDGRTAPGHDTVTVSYAMLIGANGQTSLNLGLHEYMHNSALFIVDGKAFSAADATTRTTAAYHHQWTVTDMTWTSGDTITLDLFLRKTRRLAEK